MKKISLLLFLVSFGFTSLFSQTAMISRVETDILNLVNEYRVQNGLPELQISQALCYVADVHVKDLYYNKPQDKCGSLNSWSKNGDWKSLCFYKTRNAVKKMKKKPAELTNYKGQSIEIYYYNNGIVNANDVVSSWKLFPQFNSVILNQQPYASPKWEVMGIAEFNGYISLWFGPTVENAGLIKIEKPVNKPQIEIKKHEEDLPGDSISMVEDENSMQYNSNPNVVYTEKSNGKYNSENTFHVIVFSSSDLDNSKQYHNNLIKKGFAEARLIRNGDKIRISIKSFATRNDAEKFKNKLIKTSEYKDAWILQD